MSDYNDKVKKEIQKKFGSGVIFSGQKKEEYPTDLILEEVYVPGEQLYLDFYLPLRKLIVEVNGAQHDKYIPFFHGSLKNFLLSKANDNKKKEWATLNNMVLIVLLHSENIDEWRHRIRNE